MAVVSPGEALEREHREIDAGIEPFSSPLSQHRVQPGPLLQALEALRRHIYLEEEFLLPPLYAAGMTMPLLAMLREHGQIWDTMEALEQELAGSRNAVSLSKRCRELVVQLQHHNLKEERIIYPQADQVLPGAESARLSALISSATMPGGWRCERAAPRGPSRGSR
jgi:regulator of cell morphogenesis and NO signaling